MTASFGSRRFGPRPGIVAARTGRWCCSGSAPAPRTRCWWRCAKSSFSAFPDSETLAERREVVAEAARAIVRNGQLPFVASMVKELVDGVPREPDALLRINGVGVKIAECVLAYGWGEEALPLDANCIRVLDRVFGLHGPDRALGRTAAALRDGLKCGLSYAPSAVLGPVHWDGGYPRDTKVARTVLLRPNAGVFPVPGERVRLATATLGPVGRYRGFTYDLGRLEGTDPRRELINEPFGT